jgi:hypothetical protein
MHLARHLLKMLKPLFRDQKLARQFAICRIIRCNTTDFCTQAILLDARSEELCVQTYKKEKDTSMPLVVQTKSNIFNRTAFISGKDSLVDSSSEANSLHLPRSSLLGKKNFLGV